MTALDGRDATATLDLVASVEPAVVFRSLAAHCAFELCDEVTIDLVDGRADGGTPAQYRIVELPPSADGRSASSTSVRDVVQVHFSHPQTHEHGGFRGTAVFVWDGRAATSLDRSFVAMLVAHAIRTVAWQRSEQAEQTASSKADNLGIALQNSRHIGAAIGILMIQHKITEDHAFELLRGASQHSHRKLRDVAADVIDTGWLDPSLLR